MKTYYFSNGKLSIYSILGLMAFVVASCGSYQDSSYYDHDGIYDNSQRERSNTQASEGNSQNNHYKDYFSSLKDEQTEIFTDVDNYATPESKAQDNQNQEYSTGYSGWGNDSDNVNVSIYGNSMGYWNDYWYGPYWGFGWYGASWSFGWGWYGPSWGWGWNSYYPPYYYGCPNYYYGNGSHNSFYGNNHYTYQTGRRGDYYNGTRSALPARNYSNGTRSYSQTTNGTRSWAFSNSRNNPRNNTSTNNYSNTRGNDVRQNTPTRSYSPSYNNGGGGSRGGGYSNGGYSSGGRGGGYSGGGGSRGGGRR